MVRVGMDVSTTTPVRRDGADETGAVTEVGNALNQGIHRKVAALDFTLIEEEKDTERDNQRREESMRRLRHASRGVCFQGIQIISIPWQSPS